MQRYYHLDLTGLWRGELSLRRLRVLLDHLPANCRTAVAIEGLEGNPWAHWSLTDTLLGRLTDELAAYRWQWESSHSKNGRPVRRPPESVLPEVPRRARGADVIPLVSPHSLGAFINDEQEGA